MQRGFLLRADDRLRKRRAQNNKSKAHPNIPPLSQQQQQQQSQSNRHRDVTKNVSQDLITLENIPTEQAPSLLLVERQHDDNDKKPIKFFRPLLSIIDDENDDSTTASMSDKAELPLPTQPLVSIMVTNSQVSEKEEFLFQESVTTYSSAGGQRVAMEPRMEPSRTSSAKSIPTVEVPGLTISNTTITNDFSSNTVGSPLTLLDFQQMLARMKWKDYESIEMDDTVAKWNATQATWAWEWLLSLDGKTQHVLVDSLLCHHPWTLHVQLKSDTAQDRAQSLKLLQWIQDYLTTTKNPRPNNNSDTLWNNLSSVDDWLDTILSKLSTFLDHRRTILSQQAWTTSVLIIAKFATKMSSPPSNVLDHLLSIQIQWKQAKKTTPKTEAQITLLQHWIKINQTCCQHEDQVTWRLHILGIRLEQYQGFGGLVHLFCSESFLSERFVGDDLSQELWNLLDGSLLDKDGTTANILWRGILAHLSTIINHLDYASKTKTRDKIMDLLPKIKHQSDCDLAISILKLIWSDNGGLPGDLASFTGSGLPNSIERLWSCIHHLKVKQQSDTAPSPWDPLFSFLAQCIIQTSDSVAIVDNLLSREGITWSACRGFCNILFNLRIRSSATTLHNADGADDDRVSLQSTQLRDHVQNVMINNIPRSSLLRAYWLCSTNDILQGWNAESLHQWIPKLLQLQYKYSTSTDEFSRDVVSTIASILTKGLECCIVQQSVAAMVHEVVTFLVAETSSAQDSTADFSNGVFCSTFCTKWRVVLLENQGVPDTAFSDTVVAIASAVCDYPSSVAILVFFGALMGDHVPSSVSNTIMTYRIMLAMESFLSFCGSKLEEHAAGGSDSILTRLSPLLLLRRVPSGYFAIARVSVRNIDSSRIQDSSLKVEQYLGAIFELPWANGPEFSVTPEERRLAAEVAGRSFAFGQSISIHPSQVSPPFTTFAWICCPIFRDLIQKVQSSNLKPTQIPLVKRARLALYTACHSIQRGTHQHDEPCDQEFYKTTSFAFFAVSIDLASLTDDVANEIIQLQRGCIEFFAICFAQRLAKEKLKESNHGHNALSIGDVVHQESVTDTRSEPFDRLWQAALNILQTDIRRREDEWICSAETEYVNSADSVVRKPSVQARTCFWNALALLAQRCDDKDGSLAIFADMTLRWIVESVAQQTSRRGDAHHPMCSAAAMQVVFIIITRSKSIDCLRQDGDSRNHVKVLYLWALRELQNTESGKEIRHMLSLAALKLILALLTLVSMISETGSEGSLCLDLEQINDTVTILQDKINVDVEEDIRGLSNNILSVLRLKV